LFEIIRGPSIATFLDVLAFYNIIEIENQKLTGGKQQEGLKVNRFYLKVEFNEL
jgi:hypothetical protein